MKNSELIEKLQQLPPEHEVCIFDWRLNINQDTGDGSGAGIYPKFEIEFIDESQVTKNSMPYVALSFKNIDYDDLGRKEE